MPGNSKREAPAWHRVVRDGYLPIATLYTNVVNQRLALPVTYLAWRLGLSPNVLTATSALLTTAAGVIIVAVPSPTIWQMVIAYLLLNAGYVLDSSDGQLARVSGLGTRFGAWFDHFVDGAKIAGLNLCFGWRLIDSWHRSEHLVWAYLALALNVFFQSMLFFGAKLKIARYGGNLSTQLGADSRKARLLKLPFELIDWGLFILFTLLLPWQTWFFYGYLVYGFGCAALACGYFAYSARQMWMADSRGQE